MQFLKNILSAEKRIELGKSVLPKSFLTSLQDDLHTMDKIIVNLLILVFNFIFHTLSFLLSPYYKASLYLLIVVIIFTLIYLPIKYPFKQHYRDTALAFVIAIYGPICIALIDKMYMFSIAGTSIFPFFVLMFTKRISYGIVLAIFEMIKCVTVYPYLLFQKIASFESVDEVKTFIHAESQMIILLVLISMTWTFYIQKTLNDTQDSLLLTKKQLEKSNKELQESFERLELFLLSFSHEFRNPLNSMHGNIELAYEETNEPTVKQKLKHAKVCGELILGLLNNVLDSAKASLDKLEICAIESDSITLIEKIWFTWREIIKNRGLTANLTIAPNIPKRLILDPYRLTQILFNLLGNAAKFTPQGSIKIRVSWTTKKVLSVSGIEDDPSIAEEDNDANTQIKNSG